MMMLLFVLLQTYPAGLDSEFHYERLEARKALLEQAKKDHSVILPLLRSDNFRVVQAACWVAAHLKTKEALPLLLPLLKSENPQVALSAARAMKSYDIKDLARFADNIESPTLFRMLVKKMKQEILRFIEKECTVGAVFFFFPNQFARFRPYRKFVEGAIKELLQEILDEKRRPDRSMVTLLVYAVGDLKLKKLTPLLKALAEKESRYGVEHTLLLAALYLAGDEEPFWEEVKGLEKAIVGAGVNTRGLLYEKLADLYHQARLYRKAENYYRLALNLNPDPDLRLNFACLLSVSGKVAEALTQLEKGIEEMAALHPSGEDWKEWLLRDGELEAVRKLPGFERLRKKFGLRKSD